MKRYNIFWFIIDSVRYYKTGIDDRDKIDVMDIFGKDSIEFTNCVTSAPSSLLSAGAMFTGLPSTFVSRHFNDFKVEDDQLDTIKTLVSKYGYRSFPIIDSRDLRIPMNHTVPNMLLKELPKGYKLSDYAWHNKDINHIFKHILKNQIDNQPFIFTVWNDCRRDKRISDYVKEMLNLIKENGLYNDSIIIMHSDHGYPDPRSEIDEKYFKKFTQGNHDLILTDDNIKVPFYLKYPDGPVNLKIGNCIGLIDVLPTIFDIIGSDYKVVNEAFQGKSLLPIIGGEEKGSRIRITDTRLPMDCNRLTSLRSDNFKYIFIQDTRDEYLFDLSLDPKETTDIKSSDEYQRDLNFLRNYKVEYEKSIFFFHENQLKINAAISFSKISKKYRERKIKALIVSKAIPSLIMFLTNSIKTSLNCNQVDLMCFDKKDISINGISNHFFPETFTPEEVAKQKIEKYDIVFYLTENSSRVYLKNNILAAVKKIPSDKYFLINYNFELFNYFVSKWLRSNKLKIFLDWDNKGYLYKQEPFFFVKDLVFFMIWAIKKIYYSYLSKEKEIDLKAAKDIMDFRKFHTHGNETGLDIMDDSELENEFDRIKTREK